MIELLAATFIVAIATVVYSLVHKRYGLWPAVGATIVAVFLEAWLAVLLYRWDSNRRIKCLTELRETYTSIYRIKELPTEVGSIIKPEGAEILVGDYGWEARPSRRDGLIHLQGLTTRWHVVWHAGFHPSQIEKVAEKPSSQYDYWVPYWAKTTAPFPCPFPVQERKTPTMGLPHHSGKYFENYPSDYGQTPEKRNE